MSFNHAVIARPVIAVTIPDTDTTITSSAVTLNGLLRGVTVVAPALTSSATLTVAVIDADGTTIFSKAAIPGNAKTAIMIDANNYPLQVPLSGSHTIAVTASGAQTGAKAITVNLLISK